jgi:hypothetical protein
MRNRNEIPKCFAIAVALTACVASVGVASVFAKGMREFAGSYRILQATNQDGQVEVRISLRVFNYSQADVKGATISLTSSLPYPPRAGEAWEKEQPSFQGVTLPLNERQAAPPLEGAFTVPASEYARWLKGVGPQFVIDYQDACGKPHHRDIELTPRS